MIVFADTSGLFAILDRDDDNHVAASRQWLRILDSKAVIVTTNYVLVETTALVQRRLGIEAVRRLQGQLLPVLEIRWIDQDLHAIAMTALLAAARRKLSLVDCSSFIVMREAGITSAFAFDVHFVEEGFDSH